MFVLGFPVLAFGALLCMKESPVYLERRRRLLEEAGPKANVAKLNLEKMKFPASSPTVYIPFVLISGLISLQHFSGFTYTKRFTIQVLGAMSNSSLPVESQHSATVSRGVNTSSSGSFSPDLPDVPVPLNTDSYYWAMLVCGVYLVSSLLVARLLRSIRRRFMFFISLFLTSLCLLAIGFLMEDEMVLTIFSHNTVILLKVVFLCLHTFVVQCGLQGLPTQLADILFPSSCKSIMKGTCKAMTSLTLVIFISLINLFPIFVRFWVMAAVLFVGSPLLFIFVPEIRNIGKGTAGNFILPVQTVFYILLPKVDMRKKWQKTVKKVSMMKAFINIIDKKLAQEEALDSWTNCNQTFTFRGELVALKDFKSNPALVKSNEELMAYIANILPGSGFLHRNWREDRIMIGRGPTKFPNDIKENGGIFLFDDVLILAKCLLRNWRYVNEICFNIADLRMKKKGETLELTNCDGTITIAFGDDSEAEMWRRYIEFCQTSMERSNSQKTNSESSSPLVKTKDIWSHEVKETESLL